MGFHRIKVEPAPLQQQSRSRQGKLCGLGRIRVQPVLRRQQSHAKVARPGGFACTYDWLIKFWRRSQIGQRSQYSVERFLSFRDYYQHTSITRAVAVCLLTPVPAVLVALLTDSIPLKAPSDGWRSNSAFWIRLFVDVFAIAVGLSAQVKDAIVEGAISNRGAVAVAFGTAILFILLAIAMVATWRFPVPFGGVLAIIPLILLEGLFTVMAVGPRVITQPSVLRQQVKAQLMIVGAQGLLAITFPIISTVFYRLTAVQQIAFVFATPILKLFTKQVIANVTESLHEYVGVIVVFSVDVFHIYYVAICMQTAKLTVTMLLIIASDAFQLAIALHAIFRRLDTIKTRKGSNSRLPINYLEDLPVLIHAAFENLHISLSQVGRVRIFAPLPLPLSNESTLFMNEITISRRNMHVYYSSCELMPIRFNHRSRNPSLDHRERKQFFTALRRRTRERVRMKNMASPDSTTHKFRFRFGNRLIRKPSKRKGSVSRRLLTLLHPDTVISTNTLRAILSKSVTEEVVWEALQTLFHSEYLLMSMYIRCMLPMLYSGYLSLLFILPVKVYYPQTVELTPERLAKIVAHITVFAAVEFAGFAGLILVLRRKFGISPLFQLAFVLETQARTVQGHLFVWTIFILHLPLFHYGVNFNVSF